MATTIHADGTQYTEFDKPLDWVFDMSEDKQFSFVLSTDYENYSAVYMCADGWDMIDRALQVVYVYTRDPTYVLPDDVRADITAKVQAIAPEYLPEDSYYGDRGADECTYEEAQA